MGKLATPHTTHPTKRETPNTQPPKIAHLNTTRLQHRLPSQIATQHLIHTRTTNTITQTWHTLTATHKIFDSQQHQL